MILFTKSRLSMAMIRCPQEVKKIAEILDSSNICSMGEFQEAVEKENVIKINGLLEKAISKFTERENIIYGLRTYCEKFSIPITKQVPEGVDLLLLIGANADKIEQKLNEEERKGTAWQTTSN